jgi:uncharacterized protein (TIGR02217 family)
MIGFHEVRFPEDVSWGSKGGPVFKTQVFTSHRGLEKRNVDWSQPLMSFNAAYGVRRDDQIASVINFFNARQGQLFGFRYKNWCNYKIKNGPIATGDGFNQRLPMWKFYATSATSRHYKRIRKIVRGSVTGVRVGNSPIVEGVDFNIDYDSGEIALNFVIGRAVPIYADYLEFDEPVRFDDDNITNAIEAYNNNSLNSLSLMGVRGSFSKGSAFSPDRSVTGYDDPYYGRTFLLLNFDNTGNQTAVEDQSLLANAVNFSGSARVVTTAYRHGSGALSLGSTGMLSTGGDAFQFGPVPFTVDAFLQKPLEGAGVQPIVGCWDEAGSARSWLLRYNFATGRLELLLSADGTASRIVLSHAWESIPGFFDYVSVDRTSGGWYILRVNGQVKITARDLGVVHTGTAPLTVGNIPGPPGGVGSYQGIMDSVRVTVGVSRNPRPIEIEIPLPHGVS